MADLGSDFNFEERVLRVVAKDLKKENSFIRKYVAHVDGKKDLKVANVEKTFLSDKKRKEKIFESAKAKLVDFLRVYTNFNSLKMFLFLNPHLRVPLVFPEGFELVLTYGVEGYEEDKLKKYAALLCCPEELTVLGYIKHTVTTVYELEYETDDVVILLGKVGRVYAHTTLFPDQLCRVGDTIDSFLRKGLKRCLYAYVLCKCLQFEVSDPEIEAITTCAEILAFRDRHLGEKFELRWPARENILFHHRKDSFHFVSDPEIKSVLADMCFFASFGLKCFSDGARISLYADCSGKIYGFNDNDPDGNLTFIAESFQVFRFVGVRNFYKHHTFYAAQPKWCQKPLCHFSSRFYLKTARQGDCDLLFLAARADERAAFPDVGTQIFRC